MQTPFGRIYSPTRNVHEEASDVVELHVGDNIIGQLSQIEAEVNKGYGDGFLIRVWGPNKTLENGGSNLDALCIVITFDANGIPKLHSLRGEFDYA